MFVILLILIFTRPFISSLAFPHLNTIHSVLLIALLTTWVIIKKVPFKKIRPLKYPLIMFCLALIISLVFSINKLKSLAELYKYITGLLLFIIAASLNDKDKLRIIQTLVITGLIISLAAIYQYFFGFRHLLNYIAEQKITSPFALDYATSRRVFFPFVSPNTLAGYLIMIIPLALTLKNKALIVIPLAISLILTRSLGALLSIFLALGTYLYLPKKRKLVFLLGLLAVIGLVFIIRTTAQKQYLQPVFSTLMRLNYWRDSLTIIKMNPLIGVGLGNFNLVLSRYAHNSYLQIWAEMGILGILSLFWIIYLSFTKAKAAPAGLILANAAFLIHNLIDFSFFLPEVSFIWWVILGLIISEKNII